MPAAAYARRLYCRRAIVGVIRTALFCRVIDTRVIPTRQRAAFDHDMMSRYLLR